jgi:ribonuclease P/MRP protein subunit RPP1
MKRLFIDLHLCPPMDQIDKVRSLIEKSAELGYSAVGLTFQTDAGRENIEQIKKICKDVGLDPILRRDLSPKNAKDLLNTLRKVRRVFEVIAVYCSSKEIAIQAAKDQRVDLLFFSQSDPKKHFFSASEAKLASEKSAALEINLTPLIYLEGYPRIRLLNVLRKETLIAAKFGVPIILSSGASSPQMLRKPEDYVFLTYLIGLDVHAAEQAISDNPRKIVERNRRKLSQNYVCPGVYLVKRGEDC